METIDKFAQMLLITHHLEQALEAMRSSRTAIGNDALQDRDSRWRWSDVENEIGHAYECSMLELQVLRTEVAGEE